MSEACENIHNLFNAMKRYSFPFDKNEIPLNGIYILFEKGERAHNLDRIVRVGTHTGKNQLPSRLYQHFVNENKDRSIFRKNIGRTILTKSKDSFLLKWELDLTPKKSREKYSSSIDFEKQKAVEKKVSGYIQKNFSFAVLEIPEKSQRLNLESKIISTVSLCTGCCHSKNWLGLFSPKKKIRESGLWLVNELYKMPLSKTDFAELRKLVKDKCIN